MRADYGKGKPLLWSRLVCSKCRSRAFTITAIDIYADHRSPQERAEAEAQSAFEAKMEEWNPPYDDGYW